MMATIRSVRFNDSHLKRHSILSDISAEIDPTITQLPSIYDDASYSPYDIYTAASIGDAENVEANLQYGFDSNRLNSSYWTPLMYSSYLGHHKVCCSLIKYGAAVNMVNDKGQSALMLAATCGNLVVVKLLIQEGSIIDQQDLSGDTALAHATTCSQTNVVEVLLEAGADSNTPNNNGMTPTLIACSTAHELTLLALLQNGGDVNVTNSRGEDGRSLAFDNPKAIAIINDPPSVNKNVRVRRKGDNIDNLNDLLHCLNLGKYIPMFAARNVNLESFMQLTDAQLSDIDVKAFGPRKKMLNVIHRYQKDGIVSANLNPILKIRLNDNRECIKPELNCEQVTNELMECQQSLADCQNELQKAHEIIDEQRRTLEKVSEAGKISHTIAYSMLTEVKQLGNYPVLERDIQLLIKNINSMAMKMLELPKI